MTRTIEWTRTGQREQRVVVLEENIWEHCGVPWTTGMPLPVICVGAPLHDSNITMPSGQNCGLIGWGWTWFVL